ncbi:MAG: ATP-binding protein [Solirubrobacterales bacterium]|nr:ATP-binding protein [Solirubrobacterales bacterium]
MAMTGFGIGLDESCPAHPTQIAPIRRGVSDVARREGAADDMVTRIELAVTEAATNVVLHAYRDAATSGCIHVVARRNGAVLEVRVRDDGIGMAPHPASPGLGLGLSLMAHEADGCEIHAPAGGGTEIVLRFDLRHADQSVVADKPPPARRHVGHRGRRRHRVN